MSKPSKDELEKLCQALAENPRMEDFMAAELAGVLVDTARESGMPLRVFCTAVDKLHALVDKNREVIFGGGNGGDGTDPNGPVPHTFRI